MALLNSETRNQKPKTNSKTQQLATRNRYKYIKNREAEVCVEKFKRCHWLIDWKRQVEYIPRPVNITPLFQLYLQIVLWLADIKIL